MNATPDPRERARASGPPRQRPNDSDAMDDDARVDEMSMESFPASDPPASTHASLTRDSHEPPADR
ncbi:MAG TPA: hypothetical protein VFK69_00100 [Candidatus Eisenbacteria bacterium]|nr:hypothetical protein [Candidatus Eisenbacteria bacterium]